MMTRTLTEEEYETLVDEIVTTALDGMRERPDVPTDNLDNLDSDNRGFRQEVEKAILLTPYEAFNDKSLANFENEMSATFAGSIIDHADVAAPKKNYAVYRWDSPTHVQRVAVNNLYTDVRRRIFSHFRQRIAEETDVDAAA